MVYFKQYNKSFIDKACSIEKAGYWSVPYFMDQDTVEVHKDAKNIYYWPTHSYPCLPMQNFYNGPKISPAIAETAV